jgi:hypothetical protein
MSAELEKVDKLLDALRASLVLAQSYEKTSDLLKKEADTLINALLANDNDDKQISLEALMACIDKRYNILDTPEEWNKRLRANIKNCFNKMLLTAEDRELFQIWRDKMNALPVEESSRLKIFSLAPLRALHIVGL